MTRARQDRVLALLVREHDWMTAAALADALGVTPRSIRSYVTALNARAAGAIESGPQGYRAGSEAPAALQETSDAATPRDRLHAIVRALLDVPEGIDVFETADRLFVSSATIEADLSRIRGLLSGTELTLERSASRARLTGAEMGTRRLLSRLVHDEMDAGSFDLVALRRTLGEGSVAPRAFGPFKTALVAGLTDLGYFVNEYGIADVITHIGIAADRVAAGRPLEEGVGVATPAQRAVAQLLERLIGEHMDVVLGAGDLLHLATLVLTRVVAPGAAAEARAPLDPEVEQVVREVVAEAAAEFLVEIAAPDFVQRLGLHVQNLRARAREQAWSRNPLTKSLKATYPMIFEVAVYIASRLHERLDIPLLDDEIAYIAMHVGGQLERSRRADQLLSATIVCPGYYELHELLRSSIDRSLGQAIEVVEVTTRVDPDWASIDTDLVLTTIDPPIAGDRFVHIQPFLTPADVERVQAVAGRIRRGKRLARLRAELERYFDPAAFLRGLPADGDEESVIRRLGGMLVARGAIDEDYLDRAVERERLSSTAFTDALAVPHALGMTASRTAIAIGIADQPRPWGSGRVQVVAFAAFSEGDREAFQTVFEQFVEVFSEWESVQRIVRRGTDFSAFLDELVAVIDG
ncbi:transcription antiterminator [Microbacterium sp. SORGH_AS_0888]|uniref:BglG family transcription antiterminator n=1 Tax=Microbacterium sp. SORGH_AS_0888 TaxID=3041791 RepID=UPI002782DCBB|nr:PTS sugar transporter subunit IIA [Microbacterium sp. SORGH_AS_0888]MDQ1131379.1 lichenan operon transcriptional antiterminator [Microbacterium sp. SORGH_AS_0888]